MRKGRRREEKRAVCETGSRVRGSCLREGGREGGKEERRGRVSEWQEECGGREGGREEGGHVYLLLLERKVPAQ